MVPAQGAMGRGPEKALPFPLPVPSPLPLPLTLSLPLPLPTSTVAPQFRLLPVAGMVAEDPPPKVAKAPVAVAAEGSVNAFKNS